MKQKFYEEARNRFSYLTFDVDCVNKFMQICHVVEPFSDKDFDLFWDFILSQDLVEEVEL